MVQSKFSKVITNNRGRSFVVGDLHGCYDEFLNKLDEVNFNYDEDIVICTGDLVDRGNKSLDCFNLIYKKCRFILKIGILNYLIFVVLDVNFNYSDSQ